MVLPKRVNLFSKRDNPFSEPVICEAPDNPIMIITSK